MNRLGRHPAQGILGLGLHFEHLVFQLLGAALVCTGGAGGEGYLMQRSAARGIDLWHTAISGW